MNPDDILLMVEDNPDEVELLREALSEADILLPLRVLHNGEEAIRYLDGQAPYDDRLMNPLPKLLILDLKIPLRSGLEVLEWVKKNPELRSIPVIIFTSSNEERDIKRAYELGVNSYLVKPPHFQVLVELVKSLGGYWLGFNRVPQ